MSYERENLVESYLVKQVKARGGHCRKYTSPGCAGVPDRLCFMPGGVLIMVECKSPQGRLGSHQERELARMKGLDFWAEVVWSKGDVDRIMKMYENEI